MKRKNTQNYRELLGDFFCTFSNFFEFYLAFFLNFLYYIKWIKKQPCFVFICFIRLY